jgi:peptide-methionine (S)-S-oxide reductase
MKLMLLSFCSLVIALSNLCLPSIGQTSTEQVNVKETASHKQNEKNSNAGKSKMTKEIKTEKAMFGAGCFWGVEEDFRTLPGVISTKVGFSGGTVKDPSYERVCRGDTGHAEVVEVEYDPAKISYKDLLKTFFSSHDPTTLNRQGPDVGYQYRSVIYYVSPEQEKEAKAAKEELQAKSRRQIVTEIEPAKPFYAAEEYHQHYLLKRGQTVCH